MTQAKRAKKRAEPRICYYVPIDAYIEGEGYRASVVTEGEAGHHPTGVWPWTPKDVRPYFWGHDYEEAYQQAMRLNRSMGLTELEVHEIVNSSIDAQMRQDKKRRRRHG